MARFLNLYLLLQPYKMMVFAGHVGIALILAYLFNLNPLLTTLGGVLPDLDAIFYFIGKSWVEAHRKVTHSIFLPLTLFIFSINIPYLFPVGVGVLIHFATDIDEWGLPLFFPFSNKRYTFFKKDNRVEHAGPVGFIKKWFRERGWTFYLEWMLLIIGIILNWDYLIGLLKLLGLIN